MLRQGIALKSVVSKRFLSSQLGTFKVPETFNESVRSFEPNSTDRQGVLTALQRVKSTTEEIPLVIGGKEIYTDTKFKQVSPYDHALTLANVSSATAKHVNNAIKAAADAKKDWENAPWADRAAVFLKAAELISGKYRYEILAATMAGQGKNVYQAEIDSTCELIDFLRFNVLYTEEMYKQQPLRTSPAVWNRVEYRALEGFVFAITPFNFTAIAGNLVGAPALVGNTVLWKPSNFAVKSNYLLYKIFTEAGLPDGVVNFLPSDDPAGVSQQALSSSDFAALHFTGSTDVFVNLYQQTGANLRNYKSYPRIVGETGGKNFHVVHKSANVSNAVRNTIRGAFEYQGQKCSATSRAFVSESIWPEFKQQLIAEGKAIQQGDSTTQEGFHNFIGPVIHEASFNKLAGKITENLKDKELELIVGGKFDDSKGYYVSPTVFYTPNLNHDNLKSEFFGPLLTITTFKDNEYESILHTIDTTTKYGLTGSVFAQDRAAINLASEMLRHSAGNFYINDKCTGAVVAQQWFGGGRMSGTNDKAGSGNILSRFVSIRNIKENFAEATTVLYPSNAQ